MNRKISILGFGVLCSMVSLQANAGNEKEAELRIVQKKHSGRSFNGSGTSHGIQNRVHRTECR